MYQAKRKSRRTFKEVFHRLLVIAAAVELTVAFFLVLPLMQTLTQPPETDLLVQSVDTAKLEAPPPPVQEEPEKEPEQEEHPPELLEDAQPLDLSQLELALNPGFSGGWMEGDYTVNLNTIVSESKTVDALFSISDLDQKPRVLYQPAPPIDKRVREKAPGTVYVAFVVDERGRVESPLIQKSSDPIFERPAISAVKQWKFEPGKRNGEPVKFRMRVPISFPKGI